MNLRFKIPQLIRDLRHNSFLQNRHYQLKKISPQWSIHNGMDNTSYQYTQFFFLML